MRKVKPRGKVSFGGRLLRAFERVSGFELPVPHREKSQTGVSTEYLSYDSQSNLSEAMLEAERRKAEALMNYQRRNLPC